MLINALCDYYDILDAVGKTLPKGYSKVRIDYIISLSDDGKIKNVISNKIKKINEKGKETFVSKEFLMPERTETGGPNYVEHRPKYLFGYEIDNNGNVSFRTKEHQVCVDKNLEFLKNINSPVVNAFKTFLTTWTPEDEMENPHIIALGKEFNSSNFAFCVNDNLTELLHDDIEVCKKWDELFNEFLKNNSEMQIKCAITGEHKMVARIHRKIKGIGQTTGTSLVSYKNPAEESYGKAQSLNSNISYEAMRKYTEALNYLAKSKNNSTVIDDNYFIHWSTLDNKKNEGLFIDALYGSNDETTRDDVDRFLKSILKASANGKVAFEELKSEHDISGDYYIVGLKPNGGRISVKCLYKNDFGKMMYNIAQHQEDIRIREDDSLISFWRIRGDLLKTSKDSLETALVSKLFDSIINNRPYPDSLLHLTLDRIKRGSQVDKPEKDKNGKEKSKYHQVNSLKVGLLKGYLNRKARFNNKEEEFTLALNKENKNPAYLCGRLFSIMEDAQKKASSGLNKTIKDKYFSAAMARPANVFPVLKKLNAYHLSKLENAYFIEKEMAEIIDMLGDNFPTRLSSEEQGAFIIGYYQQEQQRFKEIKEHMESREEK